MGREREGLEPPAMTKQDRAEWLTEQDLGESGYKPKPESAVRLHGTRETTKHLVLKALVAQVIQERGRRYDTEVLGPNGRVDVLDFGEPDGSPVVYEIQTDCTPKERREKAAQYAVGPVRDVLFIDPTDAPDDIHEMKAYVEQQVTG